MACHRPPSRSGTGSWSASSGSSCRPSLRYKSPASRQRSLAGAAWEPPGTRAPGLQAAATSGPAGPSSSTPSQQPLPSPSPYPAAWHLTGHGYLFPLQPPQGWLAGGGLGWRGIGALMLVSYSSTPCGQYHELIYIPGTTQFDVEPRGSTSETSGNQPDRKLEGRSITQIWVSNADSAGAGRRNWGLPKRLASFSWGVDPASGAETVQVSQPGGAMPFFSATVLPSLPWLSAPVDTRSLGLERLRALIQPAWDPASDAPIPGQFWEVAPHCAGRVSLARLGEVAGAGSLAGGALGPGKAAGAAGAAGSEEDLEGEALLGEELARLVSIGFRIEGELFFPEPKPVAAPALGSGAVH